MRRAATQVLRSARRPLIRSLHRGRGNSLVSAEQQQQQQLGQHGLNSRFVARRPRALHQNQVLLSSMYFRSFSVALVSGLVASGAYFAYRGNSSGRPITDLTSPNSLTSGTAQQARSLTAGNVYSSAGSSAASISPAEEAAQVTRPVLVVDQGQLYTGTIVGSGPISKTTDDYGRKVLEMMTPEQATQRIRRNEESYLVGRGKGVVRYDVVQLASNDPIEDDHAEKIIQSSTNSDWMFWGVFDGHSGWTTSAKLRQALISFVARELNTTYTASTPIPTPSSIDAAIRRGFIALDTSIVQDSVAEVLKNKSKAQAASLLAPALSGSCALLSFYDSASKTLRVACTGDSRAILGRRSATDAAKWVALPLSVDQTGDNEEEAARLRREHPAEPDVVRNGRILGGLQPTRAFGDATYKWSKEIQDRMKRDYFGRNANPQFRTPPYVTAEPVITTTQVQPENGDFVVMATDGLWEMLTNEEVVGLVGQWLEQNPEAQSGLRGRKALGSSGDKRADSWLRSWWPGSKGACELPVQGGDPQGGPDGTGQRAPIRQQQWGLKSSSPTDNGLVSDRFVVEDKNVATHLIRNALGGGDRDMVCALLTLPSPYARRYRDDLTVEVIFFGDGPEDPDMGPAKVMVNHEATANVTNDVKSKL